MYINKIHIQNYRNYNDFSMNFHKGLNVDYWFKQLRKNGIVICYLSAPISLYYIC